MNTALLVEDLPEVKKTTSKFLKNHGFNIVTAGNLIDAKKIFQRRASQISVVITDCRLVDGDQTNNDGKKLASYVKKLNPDIPVVGVSAFKQEDTSVFDLYYTKGDSPGQSFFEHIDEVEAFAEKYKTAHQKELPDTLNKIKLKYNIGDHDFRTLIQHHRLTPTLEKSLLSIHNSNCLVDELERSEITQQEVKLILPDDPTVLSFRIRTPFICVVSYYSDFVLTELYGFPMIYTYGDAYSDAIKELMHLLKDYFKELHSNKQKTKNDTDVIRFYCYLKEIFGGKE